jgi:hypothetical protein
LRNLSPIVGLRLYIRLRLGCGIFLRRLRGGLGMVRGFTIRLRLGAKNRAGLVIDLVNLLEAAWRGLKR